MLRKSVVFVGILIAASILSAKTPQQLKTEMDDLLPSGMKVRMAWTNEINKSAYVYDSDENVIRELTPTSVFGSTRNFSSAYISQDGEYVVLKNKGSDAIETVKFDGTGKQTRYSQGTIVCTWRDPVDNEQCFVASGLPSKTGTWAIGITNQSKQRQIATETFPKTSSQWGFGCGLSVDGKMMGGYNNDRPGLWSMPSGSFVPAGYSPLNPPGVCGGCNFAIRPTTGGVYEYGHFHESHREICVHTADGTYKERLLMGCAGQDGEAHGLYWTNHLNYVTARLEESSPNPVLFDVVRQKCVALKDNCNGDCGDTGSNAVLLSKSGTQSRAVPAMTPISRVAHAAQKLYSIEGRLLPRSQIDASTPAVSSLRVSVGNQATAIIVGRQ